MIPREVIEEIADRCDIETIIGSYVTLKRAGANYHGLCPFHSEKTPSFTVFPATRSFYCFGCGAGGDVFTFTMMAENLDYPSAVEHLAARAGVTIPATSDAERTAGINRKRIYEMNLEAARFFRGCLFDPVIGKPGMAYLQKRRLDGATIKHFGLGFSPPDFGMLTKHMHEKGYSDEELITGFLCGKSQKTGRAYDYFRNRVMFPIIDPAGNVVAFGGRVLDDSKPKYLNSSDTPGFKKSRQLFALNYAKDACAEQLILCEGYMDVIALHAAGLTNAVATLGTAITPEQARVMAKYTKKVIISYDSDEAGQKAADRAIRLLGEVGLDVRVLHMKGAKDPDEYIKTYGVDRFRQLLGESRTGFAFKMEGVLAKFDIAQPEEKLKACEALCEVIAQVYSNVEREVYIAEVAKRLALPAEAIAGDVKRMRGRLAREEQRKQSREAYNSVKHYGDHVNPDAAKNGRATAAEETILGLLLSYDEHRAAVASGRVSLTADDFFSEFGRRVFEAVLALQTSESGFHQALLGETFSPAEMGRLETYKQNRTMLTENGVQVLEAAVASLKEEKQRLAEKAEGDPFAAIRRKQSGLAERKQP